MAFNSNFKDKEKIRKEFLVSHKKLAKRFKLYEFSVDQKLSSSSYYYDKIKKPIKKYKDHTLLSGTRSMEEITEPLETRSMEGITESLETRSIEEIRGELNRLYDSYFSSMMSLLDTLMHYMNVIFSIKKVEENLYIDSIFSKKLKKYTKFGEEFKLKAPHTFKTIEKFLNSNPYKYLNFLRNLTIHESVLCDQIKIIDDPLERKIEIEPISIKSSKRSVKKDLNKTIDVINKKTIIFLNNIYKSLIKDLKIK